MREPIDIAAERERIRRISRRSDLHYNVGVFAAALDELETARQRIADMEEKAERLRALLRELLNHDQQHYGQWTVGMKNRVAMAAEAAGE